MRSPVLLCVLCLLPLVAEAQSRGVDLYERGAYAKARRSLESELRAPGLSDRERATARLYLAASLYELGDAAGARTQLEELARDHPEHPVDPVLFPPEFVAMAGEVRKQVEAERQPPPPVVTPPPEEEAAPAVQDPFEPPVDEPAAAGRSWLLPEVFGFMDPVGKAVGLGGGLTYGGGSFEVGGRALLGDQVGVGLQVGLVLGGGASRAHVALRGTAIPGLSAYGGGPVVGARIALGTRLTALVDVGAEVFSGGSDESYRNFALTASAGIGFDLLSP